MFVAIARKPMRGVHQIGGGANNVTASQRRARVWMNVVDSPSIQTVQSC